WAEYADYTDQRHLAETTAMLDATRLRPGDRVLDLATGAGGLGLAAAERVLPGGRVVVSDVVPEMTSIAAVRARAAAADNVAVRVLDLEAIYEPNASYDVVLSRHGLQFAIEPDTAAAEIARVLAPHGRVAATVWASPEQN